MTKFSLTAAPRPTQIQLAISFVNFPFCLFPFYFLLFLLVIQPNDWVMQFSESAIDASVFVAAYSEGP